MAVQTSGAGRSAWFAILFVLTCIVSFNSYTSVNVISRVGLTHAIVDRGELTIDPVEFFTVDKAYWQGHYYCDKAPGVSLLCVPAAYVANWAADLAGTPEPLMVRKPYPGRILARYLLITTACFLVTTLLFAGLAVYAFQRGLQRLGVDPATIAITTVALAFASPFYIWSTTVFGHATGAALLFLGLAAGWLRYDERVRYLLAGLALSLAMLTDLTTAPPGLIVSLYLLLADGERRLPVLARRAVWLFAGAVPAAVTLGVYNQLAFGSPFHLGYSSVAGFEGMKAGFFGLTYPTWEKLYGITLSGYRGLIWISPVSFLALIALFWRWPQPHRALFAMVTAIAVYYLLLNASYFYWHGGYSLGPRHLTPMIPFILFALALRLAQPGVSAKVKWSVAGLTALSMVVTLVATSINVETPDDGQGMLTGHIIPRLAEIGINFRKPGFADPLWFAVVQWLLALRAGALLAAPVMSRKNPAI